MTCDVYESERCAGVLVVVPAGAATTVVPDAANLGDLKPLCIAVELDEVLRDRTSAAEVAAAIEVSGYVIAARDTVC